MNAVKEFLRSQGWTIMLRNRSNKGKQYIYAERTLSFPRRKVERYIAPVSRIAELTEEQILSKLTKGGDTQKK